MKAHIVVDLGFGDAGKGSLVDYLVRRHNAHTVIRFNGGAQAAHNVVLPDGRHHTFSQFGSGTFVPGVRTHLSRFMLVDPAALLAEERHLNALGVTDAFERLSVDRRALVVTPFQHALNRLRELSRGDGRHGSCGMGIGETMADDLEQPHLSLRVGDLLDRRETARRLRNLQEYKRAQASALVFPESPHVERELKLLNEAQAAPEFAGLFARTAARFSIVDSSAEILAEPGDVVFEGAQGVLLDEWHGFHPYTTWSTTTFANALTLLAECRYAGDIRRIGIARAYMTRHGAGPLPTESASLAARLQERHNGTNDWQLNFRFGWPDPMLMRYALRVTRGVDELALTCLDQLAALPRWKVAHRYAGMGDLRPSPSPDLAYQAALTRQLQGAQPVYDEAPAEDLPGYLRDALGVTIGIDSFGPTHADKRLARRAHRLLQPV